MKVINSIDRGLAKIEEVICLILLTAMICVVTLQVLNQAFLHIRTIVWTEEVSRILFVWSIMIGSSLAVRKGDHLTVDFIYTHLKGAAKYICRVLILLICIVTCAYITRSGVMLVLNHIKRSSFFGITLWPMWVASIAVPIGFGLMTLRFLMLLITESVAKFKKTEPEPDADSQSESAAEPDTDPEPEQEGGQA